MDATPLFTSKGMSLTSDSHLGSSLSLCPLNKRPFHNRVNVCNCSFSVLAPTMANKRGSVETLGAVFSLQCRLTQHGGRKGEIPKPFACSFSALALLDVSDVYYQIKAPTDQI